MSTSRSRSRNQDTFNFKTAGAYGRYQVEGKLPIEFVSTTLGMDKLSNLSYAKDIRTTLDFGLLIQRDIDEERALGEIGRYLSPDDPKMSGNPENDGIFLPPLIVAIVNIDEGRNLAESYPSITYKHDEDLHGDFLRRTWGNLFELDLFPAPSGPSYQHVENDGTINTYNVNLTDCLLKVNIGRDSDLSGGRLVVIDGQHRLFALNALMKDEEHRRKLKNLIIPVCILFSPESTAENVANNTPSIPAVLRKLFIDVNNNAKTVSGHFSILLSNDNVGDLVCNDLCSELLNEKLPHGGTKLSLLEWNTKANKESKTISKSYTISSIGVIHDGLKEIFGKRNGIPVLEYLLNLDEVRDEFDFGEGDDGSPLPRSIDFPWRDIPYANKKIISEQINNYFTPCLKSIFFDTPAFAEIARLFDKKRQELERLSKERTPDAGSYAQLLDHLDQFEAIKDKSVKTKHDNFSKDFQEEFKKNEYLSIIRFNVFQKGLLTAWFNMLMIGQQLNLKPLVITSIFTKTLQRSLETGLFINDLGHIYLQDAVFNGIKIKATKEARLQISRLILAMLGGDDFDDELVQYALELDSGLNANELKVSLSTMGDESATLYLNTLHSQLFKSLSNEYRSRSELTPTLVSELRKLEEARIASKKQKRNDKSVELDDRFDRKIRELIKPEFESAKEQLEKLLGFGTVCDELLQDTRGEYNSEDE